MTEGLIDDEEGGFRAGRGCIDQIFTLEHIGEKAREKKCRVYVASGSWVVGAIRSLGLA